MEHANMGSSIWIVEDYDTSGEYYEIWGEVTEISGVVAVPQTFCFSIDAKSACTSSGTSCYLEHIVVYGSLYEDEINFGYVEGSVRYNLKPTTSTPQLTGYAFGGDSQDSIQGSGDDGFTYHDWLCGLGSGDEINGHPGDDVVHGGGCGDTSFSPPAGTDSGEADGADILIGGDGNDYMTGDAGADIMGGGHGIDNMDGGAGEDIMLGGPGNDIMVGGSENDRMNGGPDNDWLDGEGHADIVCGGTGTGDVLQDSGSSGATQFWGADTGDSVTCSSPSDTVDIYSSPYGASCSTALTPPSCP
jgi:Ca2+-binding RTX toxin-like protein